MPTDGCLNEPEGLSTFNYGGSVMLDDKVLVDKADIALSDLISNGGYLQPAQANRFYRLLIDQPALLNDVRQIRMARPKMEINKIGFSARILRAASQGAIGSRKLSSGDRVAPTTSKITLTTSEIICQVDLPYEVIEDNIEGGEIDANQFQETVLELMAARTALDLEELLISGDTGSGDAYLALQNGVLKNVVSNIVNNAGAPISPQFFADMIKALPTRFHRLLGQYRFYLPTTKVIDYRMQVAQRQTALGDAVLQGTAPVSVLGVGMVPVAYMPVDKSVLIIPQNIIWGIQRDIRMEFERDIQERVIIIVLTMRIATNLEDEPMVVKGENIG